MKPPLAWLLGVVAIVLVTGVLVGGNSAFERRLSAFEAHAATLEDRARGQTSFARDRDVAAGDIYATPSVIEFAGDGHLRRDMLASLTLSDRQEARAYLLQRSHRAARLMLEARTDFAAKKFDADAKLWMQSYYDLTSAMSEKATDK